MTARGNDFVSDRIHVDRGGPRLASTSPRVWTLTDGEPGNETQVHALTQALGWPTRSHRPPLNAVANLPFQGQGAHLRGLETTSRDRSNLEFPWPDLLIVAGRRIAPVARKVREESRGRTVVVALGAKTATPADRVDLAVTPVGATLFPHPNRFEVDRPLIPVETSSTENSKWRGKILATPSPRLVVLVGSGTERLGIDRAGGERLGRLVADSARALGASVLISGSRHANAGVLSGFVEGVGTAVFVHRATRDQRADERAWPVLLEKADLFILLGLGEVTLAEITATGRPVFLAPQLNNGRGPWERVRDRVIQAVVDRAMARPENNRGTTRPQEGLELICAKLIERGWIRPRRDVEMLRGRLVRNGRARLFRGVLCPSDLEAFASPVDPEVLRVAAKVRSMLGITSKEKGDES
jgi:mitochondrial fission protein ELM1